MGRAYCVNCVGGVIDHHFSNRATIACVARCIVWAMHVAHGLEEVYVQQKFWLYTISTTVMSHDLVCHHPTY